MRNIPADRIVDIPAGNAAEVPRQALVPVAAAAAPVSGLRITRPDARFVAQLIATAADAPQTRARRRAGAADGVTVYGEVADRAESTRPAQGRILSRVA